MLNGVLLAVTKGVMHGAAQGIIQGVSGGNAGQSFITALATSIAGDAFGAIGGQVGDYAHSIVGQSLFGAVTGGVVSNMQGGNFWEGAAIGLTVGLLNHAGKKLFDAIHRNSFTRVYDKNGNYIGKIKVVNYKASHKTDGTSGVEIDLEFKAVRNSGYRNFRWVQTVRTDSPRGGTTQTYNDPRPADDSLPFYYTNAEMSSVTNINGNDLIFHDFPRRFLNSSDTWWKGELSLVGYKNGSYHELHTLNYGFDIRNHNLQIGPLLNARPTNYQLNSF